ncbi:AAA family ATPase [Bacillus toyonensis]|uniref:AAA family ATPase n=1 Tax=Bacillus toyonensis TaxID=155322 RepID=UPI000CD93A2A|nr:AAA family ATPase [Bacillus toyonensis]MED3541314.1 AAA family ATPase [Bacillus toyonensis]
MNTKLVYLYIKDINRGFGNIDFNFTEEFIVEYYPETHVLNIEKNEEKAFELWGERINSIDLIVGKNGAGKSTILDLIAETNINRRHLFNKHGEGMVNILHKDRFSEWFAIYHVEDDKFVVEGAGPNLLFKENLTISHEYSFVCRYAFDEKKLYFTKYIQFEQSNIEKEHESSLNNTLIFMYGNDSKGLKWLKTEKQDYGSDQYVGFKRVKISQARFGNIYHFLTKEYEMLETKQFTAQNAFCIIDKGNLYRGIDLSKKDMDKLKLLYHGQPLITSKLSQEIFPFLKTKVEYIPFSKKEKFIITLLENYIVNAWVNGINKDSEEQEQVNKLKQTIDAVKFKGLPQEKSFEDLLKYLFLILNHVCNALSEKYLDGEETYYAQALIDFIDHLQIIKDEYFISYDEIKIPINSDFDENIEMLLTVYDSYSPRDEDMKNDLQRVIDIYYSNMSRGEMLFVNHFSSLYKALALSENPSVRNIILCLDEPEESFHPEWARKYIYYLTTFLNQVKRGQHIKYQVIISTHSPFIVSDIPKNNITCIKLLEQDGAYTRITEKANFGFGSNLYDIIKDDFFLDSSIGEFATREINKVLERINILSNYNEEAVKEIQLFINIIDDKFIQNKLNAILKQKVREIMSNDEKKARIKELEEELSRLKGSNNDKD